MVIFHSYVSLPEGSGNPWITKYIYIYTSRGQKTVIISGFNDSNVKNLNTWGAMIHTIGNWIWKIMHRNWCVSALIWDLFGIVSDFENTY